MTTHTASLDHLARPALAVFALLFAVLVLTACGTSAGTGAPSAPGSPTGSYDDPGSLIGAIADADGSTVSVRGFLIATEGGAQLCGIVLESYPPQCGGPTLDVTGEVPQDILDGLDTTSEPDLTKAWWGWVRITGTVGAGGGTPTIAIDSVELDPGP